MSFHCDQCNRSSGGQAWFMRVAQLVEVSFTAEGRPSDLRHFSLVHVTNAFVGA
jgi:hypothetical protein